MKVRDISHCIATNIFVFLLSLATSKQSFAKTTYPGIRSDTLIKDSAVALVERQITAYNEGNIEAFLEPYADDIELYNFPANLQSKGKEPMRKDYSNMFKMFPKLNCEIKARIIQGNFIIDKESISGFGKTPILSTVIYQVVNNKIRKVFFIE